MHWYFWKASKLTTLGPKQSRRASVPIPMFVWTCIATETNHVPHRLTGWIASPGRSPKLPFHPRQPNVRSTHAIPASTDLLEISPGIRSHTTTPTNKAPVSGALTLMLANFGRTRLPDQSACRAFPFGLQQTPSCQGRLLWASPSLGAWSGALWPCEDVETSGKGPDNARQGPTVKVWFDASL